MLGKELVDKMTIFEYKFTVSYKNTDIIQTVKTGSFFPLLFICIFEIKTDEKCHCQMNSKINYLYYLEYPLFRQSVSLQWFDFIMKVLLSRT